MESTSFKKCILSNGDTQKLLDTLQERDNRTFKKALMIMLKKGFRVRELSAIQVDNT